MQVTELSAAEQAKLRDKLKPVVEKFSKEFGEATAKEMTAELGKIRREGQVALHARPSRANSEHHFLTTARSLFEPSCTLR